MAKSYTESCSEEALSLPLYRKRVPVMGQIRSGKTYLINRLMGQTDEPSTDEPQISSDAQTKLREKSPDSGYTSLVRPSAIPGGFLGTVKRKRGRDVGFSVEDELRTAENPSLSFLEFSGHATCYESPQRLSTFQGIYILVMSLLQKLSDPVSDLDYMASVNNLRTGGDYLDYSLNSIRSHTLQHATRQRADKATTQPQVLIVLTHKDKVSKRCITEYKRKIRRLIRKKGIEELVLPDIFVVDNTDKHSVSYVRRYFLRVVRSQPHMVESIPWSWLHLISRLQTKIKDLNGDPVCKFQDVAKWARDPDTDKSKITMVLTFLHDRGDLIFFDEPRLRDEVTLQPQVLIDVFKTITAAPMYQQYGQGNPEVTKMWERLTQKGILSDNFLTRIWEDLRSGKPFLLRHKEYLKALLEKYCMLCNATPISDTSDESLPEEMYLVPALLNCKRDNAMLYPNKMVVCPEALYFVFSDKFLPGAGDMFCQLQALCARRFGLEESTVYAGCARFSTDDSNQNFVITKVNHYIKVELLSSSNVFTQGLCIMEFLSGALSEIKEKWIPWIKYELCRSTKQEGEGEPTFQTLPAECQTLTQLLGIPMTFHSVWMDDSHQSHLTEIFLHHVRKDGAKQALYLMEHWFPKTVNGPLHYLMQLEETQKAIGKLDLAAVVHGIYKEYREDMQFQEVDPELTEDKRWCIPLPGEGKYLCRRTDLGVVTPYPLHVTYKSANWSDHTWSQEQEQEWMPVGPFFSIKCQVVEGPVDILLPHVLYIDDASEITREDLQVVHVVGDSAELLPVTELTPSHAVTRFKRGSLFGVVGRTREVSNLRRSGLLMAFRSMDNSDLSKLKVYLVSNHKTVIKATKLDEEDLDYKLCDTMPCQLYRGLKYYLEGNVINGEDIEVKISPKFLTFEDTIDTNIVYASFRVEVSQDLWLETPTRLHLQLLEETDRNTPILDLILGRYRGQADGTDSGHSTPTREGQPDTPITSVDEKAIFDKVVENVSYKWEELARKLGLKRGEIETIRVTESLHGPERKCREVLERWLARDADKATLQVLKQALIDIKEENTAQSL
ncbi:PREDICTED: uncharacterized protein LOC109472925 [Branchiostoma belcheri]|uniref:Uncharacterized protein LOC109472925 n=1 Tax=Branchiostoma belcheri TaxID=7741 RepID=A0A6P4Z334_BRABE|nr:PREDICTED: uncharacterized protein LOC109472925 [Branchiostoma belcheri]